MVRWRNGLFFRNRLSPVFLTIKTIVFFDHYVMKGMELILD